MQRVAPLEYIRAHSFCIQVGEHLDTDTLRAQLLTAGYHAVDQTIAPSEYSVRGGLIDIFPSGSEHPFRIDLFDNQVESIRYFDPDTQRSKHKVDSIQLLPAREFPLDEAGVRQFRSAFRRLFTGDPQRYSIYRDVSNGLVPPGIEFYLPLFFEQTASFFDYLPERTAFMFVEDVDNALKTSMAEIEDRYQSASLDPGRALVPTDQLFLTADEVKATLIRYPRIQIQAFSNLDLPNSHRFHCQAPPEFAVNLRAPSPYAKFYEFVAGFSGRMLLVAETAGRRENLLGLLQDQSLPVHVVSDWESFLHSSHNLAITVGTLENGLLLDSPKLAVLTEGQLYGARVLQRRRRSTASQDPESVIRSLAELEIGDPVVHDEHGVGRYQGLNTLTIEENQTEFLTLEYYGGDKLYIPVLSLHKVSRFVGASAESAPLHKLGSETWLRAKRRAKQRAHDIAVELLEIETLRAVRKGTAFPPPDDTYMSFSSAFPFEETPDQTQVIEDVIADMCSDKPMDRLVCGDVGFGKTEVALRAAFLAIEGNRQIVVLVPTTLLAQQHFYNFTDRFADSPVTIELLSRFRNQKQQAEVLSKLANGAVDIVIGTHRLLQRDVRFERLGLIIIDEEHRFGVRQKEQLKKLRSQADILTLTATPIPRTLNIALSGLRDISIIATPPKTRLSIKTFVREWNKSMIREACLRELRRGGQLYFLHNKVRTMEKIYQTLKQLLPEADIQMAHGQMRERELEQIMSDFYHQRFSILVCTTIIESGIDIPTANTIIINRADRFGLAQLHQLRGRVGRSHHQAYAFLLVPPLRTLTADAVKRLQAIESLEDLGAGFALASHDLEIRGAGELLGESQSGAIDEVGFTMYSEFLNRSIATIKSMDTSPAVNMDVEKPTFEINLHIPALFPDAYLPDVHLRLIMYKRISNVTSSDQLRELEIEAIDRFGLLPQPAKMLFRLTELRLQLAPLGIVRVDIGPKGGRIVFEDNPNIDPGRLIELLHSNPDKYQMANSTTLRLIDNFSDPESRFQAAQDLFDILN
jgi:transcription-repair coupling factor (superfamily II helicase)